MSLRRRLNFALHITAGMSRIHDMNFIHRDIRPANILVSRHYVAKIGDMGIAKYLDPVSPKELNSRIGCARYMPRDFKSGRYTNKLDVFMYGLTLIELFCGWHEKDFDTCEFRFKKPCVFWEAIEKCVDEEPKRRPTSKRMERMFNEFRTIFNQHIGQNKPNKRLTDYGFKTFYRYFLKSQDYFKEFQD